ncbi:predicted protein [Naegleria gruberi]|uniref:Predicted protein n=1 Tax=Naegleria gruberi TaxID=5762 RepID=D2VV64_NAEGR|nr:uncharacterized protein NAEGRDRAFT_72905 [Naegleria gruberi]EFC39254.1 predicted protein [Naegleria gruberi]|eukprot:XP_002671998.1 predicted protein [Naegleria gruberi strain NEG-M]
MTEKSPSESVPVEKSMDYYMLLHFYSKYDNLGHFLYDTRERKYATCKEYLNRLSEIAEMSNYEVTPTMVRRALYIYYSCLTSHLLDPVRNAKLASCVESLESKDHIFKCKDEILRNKVFVESKVLDQVYQMENRKYNLDDKISQCDKNCSEWFYKYGLCTRFLKARRIKTESEVSFSERADEEVEESKKYYAVCDDFKKKSLSCVGDIFCAEQQQKLQDCLKNSMFKSECDDLEKTAKRCAHYNFALVSHLKFRNNLIKGKEDANLVDE